MRLRNDEIQNADLVSILKAVNDAIEASDKTLKEAKPHIAIDWILLLICLAFVVGFLLLGGYAGAILLSFSVGWLSLNLIRKIKKYRQVKRGCNTLKQIKLVCETPVMTQNGNITTYNWVCSEIADDLWEKTNDHS
jgi:hypothetical protein